MTDPADDKDHQVLLPDRERLVSRLCNWKFGQALACAELLDIPDGIHHDIHVLSTLWENSGHMSGLMGELVGMAVSDILTRLAADKPE